MIHFDIEKKEAELRNLEEKTLQPSFWEDSKNSNQVLESIKRIKAKCTKYRELEKEIYNLDEIAQLLKIEEDFDLANEMTKNLKEFEKNIEKFQIETLLSGKYDKNNAILTIHPGAGGTEANDWAEMLYRMYSRWSQKNGYIVEVLDYLEGEEAGIKSVTFEVKR